MTLLLPFTYGMDPAAGISMLLAISFGAIYGGSITAILIGTPGTPAPFSGKCFSNSRNHFRPISSSNSFLRTVPKSWDRWVQ